MEEAEHPPQLRSVRRRTGIVDVVTGTGLWFCARSEPARVLFSFSITSRSVLQSWWALGGPY